MKRLGRSTTSWMVRMVRVLLMGMGRWLLFMGSRMMRR